MKRLLVYLFLVLGLGSVFNVNAEAESFKLGVCPEIELVKEFTLSSNLYHKVYKNKSLSKIKEKLKCEPIIVDKDTSYDFYMAITRNTGGSWNQIKYKQVYSIALISDKKFSELKREYLTTETAEIKSTALKAKLEKIEQEYLDGLISNRECVKKKKRAYAGGVKEFGDITVPGCRKTKKVFAKEEAEEEKKNTEVSSKNIFGICLKPRPRSSPSMHKVVKGQNLSKIKKQLERNNDLSKCDAEDLLFVHKNTTPDLYSAIAQNLKVTDGGASVKSGLFYIVGPDFKKIKKEFGILDSTTGMVEIKIEEEKKKKELLLAQKKEDTEEKPKNYLKTKEDLEAFMIGKEIEMDSVFDGENYTWYNKYHSDGVSYSYIEGKKYKMIWEAVNGNTFKEAQVGWINNYGWTTYVLDYDNSTYLATRSKDSFNQGKYFKGNILSPEFPKKPNEEELLLAQKQKKLEQRKAEAEKKKKLAEKKIEEEKRKIAEKKKKLEDERTAIVRWEGYSDMIVGTLNFSETGYEGTINLDLPNNEGTCQGSCSLQPDGKGTWQISCTNNMGAAGTLEWEEGVGVKGIGRDYNDKKVKFAASAKS